MKLEYMKEYIAVVESLNFTTAANRLHVTQSALSRHIAVVEEYLGARLLYRDTHNVEVTSVGKLVYEEFIKILSIYDAVAARATMMNEHHSGAIRVGVPYYCMRYMDKIMHLVTNTYPNIAVELISYQPTVAYHALLNYQIDLAMLFRHDYPFSDDIRFHDFAWEQLVLVSTSNHPISQRKLAEIKDLNNYAIVLFKNNYFSNHTKTLLRKHGVYPKATIYSDHIDTLPFTLKENGGIAVEPICVANMNRPELSYIKLAGEDSSVKMTMAYRLDNSNPTIPIFLNLVDQGYPDFK